MPPQCRPFHSFSMLKLRVHIKPFNEYTDIDKYLVVPKKLWEDFQPGESQLTLKGIKSKVRIYDIPCECVGSMHNHRLIDLREEFNKIGLKDNEEIEIGK